MTTTSPPTDVSNAELIRWAFDMLNEHDVAPLKQFWTATTVERFPDRTCRGAAEIASYFEDAFAAIPDFHMEVKTIVEEGDDVFVHWHLTGTHEGSLMGIEPTHKHLEVDGMDHFVFEDGNVVSNFVVFDQMQYARQLGMLPNDGTAPDKALETRIQPRTKLAAKLKR